MRFRSRNPEQTSKDGALESLHQALTSAGNRQVVVWSQSLERKARVCRVAGGSFLRHRALAAAIVSICSRHWQALAKTTTATLHLLQILL